jgi:hypothetical protein
MNNILFLRKEIVNAIHFAHIGTVFVLAGITGAMLFVAGNPTYSAMLTQWMTWAGVALWILFFFDAIFRKKYHESDTMFCRTIIPITVLLSAVVVFSGSAPFIRWINVGLSAIIYIVTMFRLVNEEMIAEETQGN